MSYSAVKMFSNCANNDDDLHVADTCARKGRSRVALEYSSPRIERIAAGKGWFDPESAGIYRNLAVSKVKAVALCPKV